MPIPGINKERENAVEVGNGTTTAKQSKNPVMKSDRKKYQGMAELEHQMGLWTRVATHTWLLILLWRTWPRFTREGGSAITKHPSLLLSIGLRHTSRATEELFLSLQCFLPLAVEANTICNNYFLEITNRFSLHKLTTCHKDRFFCLWVRSRWSWKSVPMQAILRFHAFINVLSSAGWNIQNMRTAWTHLKIMPGFCWGCK